MRRPKLVVLLLTVGTLLLVAGSVVAASLPSLKAASVTAAQSRLPAGPSTARPLSRPVPQQPPGNLRTKEVQAGDSITYIVKPGDTLSGIARWVVRHGGGAPYTANWLVVGSNPNLIFPGERVTFTDGVINLSGTSS